MDSDLVIATWNKEMSINMLIAVVFLHHPTHLPLKYWDCLKNLLIFQLHCLANTPILSSWDVIKPESMSFRFLLWVAKIPHMLTVHLSSMSTVMIHIQTIHLKCWLPLLDKEKSDSIPISTLVERYVWVYLELGEVLPLKTGILKYQHFFNFLSPLKELLWVKMYISMNLDLKVNKELKKEIGKMKHTLT